MRLNPQSCTIAYRRFGPHLRECTAACKNCTSCLPSPLSRSVTDGNTRYSYSPDAPPASPLLLSDVGQRPMSTLHSSLSASVSLWRTPPPGPSRKTPGSRHQGAALPYRIVSQHCHGDTEIQLYEHHSGGGQYMHALCEAQESRRRRAWTLDAMPMANANGAKCDRVRHVSSPAERAAEVHVSRDSCSGYTTIYSSAVPSGDG